MQSRCRTPPSPQRFLMLPFYSHTRIPFSPLAATNLFSIEKKLLFQECYINGKIQYVNSRDWIFSLSLILWRFIQVSYVSTAHALSLLSGVPMVCAYHSLGNQPPIKGHLGCFLLLVVVSKAIMNIHIQLSA